MSTLLALVAPLPLLLAPAPAPEPEPEPLAMPLLLMVAPAEPRVDEKGWRPQDGGALHLASGVTCPAALPGTRLELVDRSGGMTQTLTCNYRAPDGRSWAALSPMAKGGRGFGPNGSRSCMEAALLGLSCDQREVGTPRHRTLLGGKTTHGAGATLAGGGPERPDTAVLAKALRAVLDDAQAPRR